MNNWTGMLGVFGALGALMVGVRAVQRRGWVGPEMGRKLVHVVMGLVCAAFPWVFRDTWPVVLLAFGTTAVLAAVRWVPGLRAEFGGVLGGISRSSVGEFYFPAAVLFVWLWTGGEPFPFTTSIMVLALADTAGALVGQRWGAHPFGAGGGRKSLEGSLAVGLVAFVAIAVLMAWLRPVSWSVLVLTTGLLTLAAVVTEALGSRGLDNLLLPVVTCLLARRCAELETDELAWRLIALALLTAPVFFVGARSPSVPSEQRRLAPRFITAVAALWGAFDWTGPLLTAMIP